MSFDTPGTELCDSGDNTPTSQQKEEDRQNRKCSNEIQLVTALHMHCLFFCQPLPQRLLPSMLFGAASTVRGLHTRIRLLGLD